MNYGFNCMTDAVSDNARLRESNLQPTVVLLSLGFKMCPGRSEHKWAAETHRS